MRTFTTPTAARTAPAARRSACCRATDVPKTEESKRNAKDVRVGFKWNPATSMWIKDDKLAGKVDASVVITPRTGAAYTIWPVMHTDLTDFGLESVPPTKAQELQEAGWTLVDVRVADKYEEDHIKGAVSIPLFRPVQGDSMMDNVKRLAMGAFAMKATEREPEFAKNVIEQLGKDAKILLVCDIGGSLKTIIKSLSTGKEYADPERAFGRESRSLKAAHELLQAGCKNLMHLEGGQQQWRYEMRMDGTSSLSMEGSKPTVA